MSTILMNSRVCSVPSLFKYSRQHATLSLMTYSNKQNRLHYCCDSFFHLFTHFSCQIHPHTCVRCEPDVIPCQLVTKPRAKGCGRGLSQVEAFNRLPANKLSLFLIKEHLGGLTYSCIIHCNIPASFCFLNERMSC